MLLRKISLLIKLLFVALIASILAGCYRTGHQDFLDYKNNIVGKKIMQNESYRYKNAGKLIRGNFLLGGPGLTHTTKDKNGNLIYHIESVEVLPHFQKKEWVGKCKLYYVVDPKTKIIKSWGFDKGGNPQSCRTWT